jgi:gliding motility-associated-like protein
MKKTYYILSILALLFFTEKAYACHGLPLLNLQAEITTTSITITAESDASTSGCNDAGGYSMQVELVCDGNSLVGNPTHNSGTILKPNATQEPYPAIVIEFSTLCPGTTYKWRIREYIIEGTSAEGPWSDIFTFTTPGVQPTLTLSVTASPQMICPGQQSVLTAQVIGGCGYFTYNWGGGITGPVRAVAPTVTTKYMVTVKDWCTGNELTDSVTVTVGNTPIAGTVTANPTSMCIGESTTLTLTGNNGTFRWQTSTNAGSTWTDSVGFSSPFVLGPLTQNTWVRARITFCGLNANSNTVMILVTTPPIVTVLQDTAICPGTPTVLRAEPNVTGGTYLWSNGATTQEITVSPFANTTYSVVYTSLGCSSLPASATVSVKYAPVVTIPDGEICLGDSITIVSTVSDPGGTYLWSNGATTPNIRVSPGITSNYSLIYTFNGCQSLADTSTITVKPIPNILVNDITICEGFSGTLSAQTNTPGGTYLWDNAGETTPEITIQPVSSQIYSVIYTLNGCSNSDTALVTVIAQPAANIRDTLICEGASTVLNPVVSAPGGTYLWSTGETTPSISVAPLTDSTFYLIYSLGTCKSDTAWVLVSIKPNPVLSVNNETICLGDSATLRAVSSLAGGTYLWTPGNSTADSIRVSPVNNTNYTVIHTVNGCSGTATGTVTINVIPGISAGPDVSICSGASTTLTASGANSYLWSPGGETTQSIIVSPLDTTIYAVTGFLNGCAGRDSVTVMVASPLNILASSTDVKCSGGKDGTINVIASGSLPPYTYNWNNNLYVQSYVDTVSAGSYNIIVTDNLNCTANATVVVNQPFPLAATSNQVDVTCNGGSDGQITITTTTGGVAPYSYSLNNAPNQLNNTFAGLSAGPYTVVITDANACRLSLSFNITQPSPILINPIVNPLICIGESTTLSASPSGGTPAYEYNWSNTGFDVNNSFTVSPGTMSSYSLVVRDSRGCTSTTHNFIVFVRDPLSVSITPQNASVCFGESVVLTAAPAGGNNANYSYLWVPGNFTTQSITVTPNDTTAYEVEINDGCTAASAKDIAVVNVNALPVVDFSSNINAACPTACITFSDNSTAASGNIITWSWDLGIGQLQSGQNTTFCYDKSGLYDVSLRVTTDQGCSQTLKKNQFIEIYPQPKAAFIANTYRATTDNPMIIFSDRSTGATNWSWNFGDGQTIDGVSNTSHLYNLLGDFIVTLTVNNDFGCMDSVSNIITIIQDLSIYIPSAFTPNGDGLNDMFLVKGIGIEEEGFQMAIYNRWGEQIFVSNNIDKGWDGLEKNNEQASLGVYVYKVDIISHTGASLTYTGHVTVVR